jgi:hypothetical protein
MRVLICIGVVRFTLSTTSVGLNPIPGEVKRTRISHCLWLHPHTDDNPAVRNRDL